MRPSQGSWPLRSEHTTPVFVLPVLWAHAGMSEVHLRQDRLPDAIATALACLRLGSEKHTVDQNSRFQVHGVLASAYVRRGEHEDALAQIEPAASAATAGAHLSFTAQAGFVGVTEALLGASASGVIDVRDSDARLRRWLWRFRAAAFCRPILSPPAFSAGRHGISARVTRAGLADS